MNDKNKAVIIGMLLVAVLLVAFLSRNLIYNHFLERQHSAPYSHSTFRTANVVSTLFLLMFSAVFSALGFRKAKEKGYNAPLWAVICFFFNLWGYLFLLLKKNKMNAKIYRIGKIDAAVDQLDWAIKLFLDYKAYVPSITLAGAAEEILGEAVASESAFRKLMDSLSTEYKIPPSILSQEYLNKTKNWLKHWKDMKDAEYMDVELETVAIQYIVRAITNLITHDKTLTSETPRFLNWLHGNRADLLSD